MESEIIKWLTMFAIACLFAWTYFATEKGTNKIMSDKILSVEKSLTEQVKGLKDSVDTQRTTLLNYKSAYQADLMQVQRSCFAIKKSHRRISNEQFRIKGMSEVRPQVVPVQVIERAH